MEQAILKLLKQKKNTSLTSIEINDLLGYKSTSEYSEVEKVLNKLCEEGKLYYSEKKRRYTPIENTNYKTGKIIPDIINTDKISDKELKKKFDTLIQKNKNYESKIKILNDNITYNKKNKKDLENIIFKQENKINELNLLLKKKDNIIKVKDSSINKNEGYSVQLMNIIKEQKLQIQNIKKQKNEDDISQIAELKRQINNLENVIELKENTIS